VSRAPLHIADLDAVLLDLGNVMVQLHVGRFVQRLRALAGGEGVAQTRLLFAEDAYHRFARGEIDPRAFHAAVQERLGLAWPFDSFVEAWCDVFEQNEQSVEALRRVREQRPVFLLSNTDTLHWEWIRGRWSWCELFHGLHLSFEVGIEKPDPRFFRTFLDGHPFRPERCLYVDDLAENVAAASSVGLVAVQHTEPDVLGRTVAALFDDADEKAG